MHTYTDGMEKKGYDISTEDEDYVEKLCEVAHSFRNFGDALTDFLLHHGFDGDVNDEKLLTEYLNSQFKEAGMKIPRNVKAWFHGDKKIKRETGFQICFALGLSLDESEDFFRKVCLSRGIDCHVIREAVYYYCLKKGHSYETAMQLLKRIPEPKKERIHYEQEIMYTAAIVEEIDRMENEEDLVQYLNNNLEYFEYNKVTACMMIRRIWKEISRENGLASQERAIFFVNPSGEKTRETKKEIRSTWEIYLQILGLDKDTVKYLSSERSIKPVIRDNILLHPFAQDCFPNRESIDKILEGKCDNISYESIRKVLILLLFYRYWIKLALHRESPRLEARNNDAGRCIVELNHYLSDAGYPLLYYGNPYDWIFLYMASEDYPLVEYRDFMKELIFTKENEVEICQEP